MAGENPISSRFLEEYISIGKVQQLDYTARC
jgi:hypothetical protein